MEEPSKKIRPNVNNKKGQKKLPWWIELLFVQIGLPEKLLVKLLGFQKKTSNHIVNKKSQYKSLLIVFVFLIYFFPIIQESRNKNKCINATMKLLQSEEIKPYRKQLAVNYCNGGSMESMTLN